MIGMCMGEVRDVSQDGHGWDFKDGKTVGARDLA